MNSFSQSPFLSCRRASELTSQALDEPLGWSDRIRLRVHLHLCDNCQRVESQMKILHDLGAELGGGDPKKEMEPLCQPISQQTEKA